jgi:hypothetical protein
MGKGIGIKVEGVWQYLNMFGAKERDGFKIK